MTFIEGAILGDILDKPPSLKNLNEQLKAREVKLNLIQRSSTVMVKAPQTQISRL